MMILKNHKNLSSLAVEEVAQVFCSASRDNAYDMGGLGIFAYILGTDNDMYRIIRPEFSVMCTAGMLVPTEKPGSETHLFPAPPSAFEFYYLAPDPGCPSFTDSIRQDHSRRQYSCRQNLAGPLRSCCFLCLRSVWLVSHIPSLEQSLLTNSTSAH